MKRITVCFEEDESTPVFPSDRLEAIAKLLESLCESADFRQRLAEFLKTYDSEVPTVSWQPPPAT